MPITRIVLLLTLGLMLTIPPASDALQAQPAGVSDARFARLARGVNLPNWFWYGPPDLQDVAGVHTPLDFALIRKMGLTHVRIPIDLGFIHAPEEEGRLNQEALAVLDEAIQTIVATNLAVIVDLHSTSLADADSSQFSGALETDDAFTAEFILFWEAFAAHLSATTDPEMVFLEPMNEPVFLDNPQRWAVIQRELLATIRAVAPEHTLLATGSGWSHLDTLVTLQPLPDSNIVYNFHFYEPFLFTHQGAPWSWEGVRDLANIPYPSSPEAVAPLLDRLANPTYRNDVVYYGEERWDAARIAQTLRPVRDWAARHGIRVICNEFGVYKEVAPEADRIQWTADVRAAFEEAGIGWTLWEYDGGFGLVTRMNNLTLIDVPMAEALGLTPPGSVVHMSDE